MNADYCTCDRKDQDIEEFEKGQFFCLTCQKEIEYTGPDYVEPDYPDDVEVDYQSL